MYYPLESPETLPPSDSLIAVIICRPAADIFPVGNLNSIFKHINYLAVRQWNIPQIIWHVSVITSGVNLPLPSYARAYNGLRKSACLFRRNVRGVTSP